MLLLRHARLRLLHVFLKQLKTSLLQYLLSFVLCESVFVRELFWRELSLQGPTPRLPEFERLRRADSNVALDELDVLWHRVLSDMLDMTSL